MFKRQALLALLFPLLVGSCAQIDKVLKRTPEEPLGELPSIETRLAVSPVWSGAIGETKQRYLSLFPRLFDDIIYVADAQGNVTAFEADKGRKLWTVSLKTPITAGVAGGESVLAVGTLEGQVIALSPKDGRELWRTQVSSEVVSIADSTRSIVAARTLDGKLWGLDTTSGEQLWQQARQTPALSLKGASRPVVDGSKVIIGMDNGKVMAVAATRGKLLWEVAISAPHGRSELERLVDIDGDMSVSEGVVYAVSYQGDLAAISSSDGRVLWSRELSSFRGVDTDNERVYTTDVDGAVWAFDRRTGGAVWKQDKLKSRRVTRPTVVGPYVVVGDGGGYLHWISAEDGRFVARTQLGEKDFVSAPFGDDPRAYVLTPGGKLEALEYQSKLTNLRE